MSYNDFAEWVDFAYWWSFSPPPFPAPLPPLVHLVWFRPATIPAIPSGPLKLLWRPFPLVSESVVVPEALLYTVVIIVLYSPWGALGDQGIINHTLG